MANKLNAASPRVEVPRLNRQTVAKYHRMEQLKEERARYNARANALTEEIDGLKKVLDESFGDDTVRRINATTILEKKVYHYPETVITRKAYERVNYVEVQG